MLRLSRAREYLDAPHAPRPEYQQSFARQERSIVPELFGIRYAEELQSFKVRELKQIALAATGFANYGNEIAKGRRLACYVQWRDVEEDA